MKSVVKPPVPRLNDGDGGPSSTIRSPNVECPPSSTVQPDLCIGPQSDVFSTPSTLLPFAFTGTLEGWTNCKDLLLIRSRRQFGFTMAGPLRLLSSGTSNRQSNRSGSQQTPMAKFELRTLKGEPRYDWIRTAWRMFRRGGVPRFRTQVSVPCMRT